MASNIIRLTTRIYPDKAGPAVYAYLLSKYVSEKYFNMFNITCRPDGFTDKTKVVNSHFKIYYLPITSPRWDTGAFKQLLFLIKFGFYSFKRLLKIHRKHRIDLIHCDNPAVTGFVATIFNRIFKIPFIYTQHGLDSHFKLNFLFEINQIFPRSAKYIIVSRRMIVFFKKNKLDTNKLIWIPVGVELDKFYHVKSDSEKERIISDLKLDSIINIDDFIIIYVGYMDLKQKVLGMIDFLNGFNKFFANLNDNQRKNLKLLYLGDGKYRNLLENELNNLNLEENVFVMGIRLDIEKFYAISDFLALTSYMEGFPTVLLEAIASDVPCICTDVGEVNEILDEDSIVPCGEREEIAAKLNAFYIDRDLCRKMVENSLNKIKKFDWSIIAKQIKGLYRTTIIKSKMNT
ncbi:MAG: glycosyltransferase [Promethearchaeota archaeon]|nr:MAG: glycosyltransferase [Candidatus Lokiarchaeota archaeon]